MAWGDSFPPVPDPKNTPKNQSTRKHSEFFELPEKGDFGYILDLLFFDIGCPLEQLKWSEIKSWNECRQLQLTPFELHMIYMLSGKYVSMFAVSNLQPMPPPYVNVEESQNRLNRQVTEIFGKRKNHV